MATEDGYIEANNYGGYRGDPRWLVLHTAECCGADPSENTANRLARYFSNPSTRVSAHVSIDVSEVWRSVPSGRVAYTSGSDEGNTYGEHIEMVTYTAQDWDSENDHRLLARTAQYVRERSSELGIPTRFLTVTELRDGRKGITTHNQLRLAFGGTDHTDPGPDFPFRRFLDMVLDTNAEPPEPGSVGWLLRAAGVSQHLPYAQRRAVVGAFQSATHLPVVHTNNKPTAKMIARASRWRKRSPRPIKGRPTLSIGSSGLWVARYQRQLGVEADGQFGPITEAAVKGWQVGRRIDVDGIIGPQTHRTFVRHSKGL